MVDLLIIELCNSVAACPCSPFWYIFACSMQGAEGSPARCVLFGPKS